MSTYPYYADHFRVRPVTASDLDPLHPVAARYLADPSLFLADEQEPRVGTPVRLAQDRTGGTRSSIELCFHDDAASQLARATAQGVVAGDGELLTFESIRAELADAATTPTG